MGEEFNMDNFMQYFDSDTEGILSNTALSDGISTVLEIINILVFLIDVTVILLMFFKCRKFRMTRAYEDFAGTKNLAKAVEIITIFLAIDAVYSLTRIFVIVDAINLLKQIIPDLPASVFVYSITVNIVLPVLSFVVSVCVWNMYHNTKKLFYSLYPNGALPVIDIDSKKPGAGPYGADNNTNPAAYAGSKPIFKSNIPTMSDSFEAYKTAASAGREEDIFGTGASVEYLTGVNKSDEAKMEELLIQDEPKAPIQPADNGDTNAPSDEDDNIFGTGNSTDWQPVGDMNSALLSDMPSGREEDDGIDLGSDDGGLFGTGTSADYMKTDEAKFAELLISEDNEQDSGLDLGSGDGDLFGSGNSTDWQPVGDINSALLSDIPSGKENDSGIDLGSDNGGLFGTGTSADYMKTDEAKFAELLISEDNEQDNGLDLGSSNEDFFGSGTTEDYMKRFTSADEAKIAELLVQDEPEEQ